MNTRNNPDGEENAAMTRDNQREVFALQMQAKVASEEAELAPDDSTATPRCDAHLKWWQDLPAVDGAFARTLERELIAMTKERDEAVRILDEMGCSNIVLELITAKHERDAAVAFASKSDCQRDAALQRAEKAESALEAQSK